MIVKGATMDTTTHSHKKHATAVAPFHSHFFESLHKEQWQEVRLGEIAEIFDHKRVPLSAMQRNNRKGIYPYYGASGIIDYIDDFIFDGEFILISEDGENLKTRKTPIAFRANGKFWVNNHAHIIKGKKPYLNSLIIYLFRNIDLNPYITGAVQPKLNQATLLNISFTIPIAESTRQQIAEILSSFDDKIDLLHRQNKTLESLALTLFRHTFVDNPKNPNAPCHSGQACNCHSEPALVGEESIDIKSHRDISASPQYDKWEIGKLGDYITPKKGKNITQKNAIKGIYPVIAGGLEPAYYHNQSNTESPVITISASGANAGFVNIHYCPVWSSDSSYIDKTITPYVYFFYLFLKMNQNILYDKQEGSAQPHIYPSHIMELEIPHYPKNLIETFESQIQIYFDKISHNMGEIQNLQSMRDMLLQKLLE